MRFVRLLLAVLLVAAVGTVSACTNPTAPAPTASFGYNVGAGMQAPAKFGYNVGAGETPDTPLGPNEFGYNVGAGYSGTP